MAKRSGRLYPRHPGFYDSVFSQGAFWALLAVVLVVGLILQACGVLH